MFNVSQSCCYVVFSHEMDAKVAPGTHQTQVTELSDFN